MKDNKHPHHDLIVEWAKDTSKEVQAKSTITGHWLNVTNPNWDKEIEFRFKPREFIKGHWYPCVDSGYEKSIYYFNGKGFNIDEGQSCGGDEISSMLWIGASLGEIKFGD